MNRRVKVGVSLLAVALAAYVSALAAGVPASVHYVQHDKVAELMAKGGAVFEDPGFALAAVRRGAGEAESHDRTNHVLIIVEGEANLVVGGTMKDPRRTAPDQMRASSLEGGTTYHLSKGDLITIPAKTPHWLKEVPTKTVEYYVLNIESQ